MMEMDMENVDPVSHHISNLQLSFSYFQFTIYWMVNYGLFRNRGYCKACANKLVSFSQSFLPLRVFVERCAYVTFVEMKSLAQNRKLSVGDNRAYGVVVSMFHFHCSDRGLNPSCGSKIS